MRIDKQISLLIVFALSCLILVPSLDAQVFKEYLINDSLMGSDVIKDSLVLNMPDKMSKEDAYLQFSYLMATFKDGNDLRSLLLDGLTVAEFEQKHHFKYGQNADYLLHLEDKEVAIIEFNNFTDEKAFDKFLKTSFKEIQKAKSKGVIIDIRKNYGGTGDLSPALIDYIYNKSYTTISSKNTMISQTLKDFSREAAIADPRFGVDTTSEMFTVENGSFINTKDTLSYAPSKNKYRFTGPVCVLIGPNCFSSGNTLADLIKTHQLATLIGEPLTMSPSEFAMGAREWVHQQADANRK